MRFFLMAANVCINATTTKVQERTTFDPTADIVRHQKAENRYNNHFTVGLLCQQFIVLSSN